MYNKIKMQEHIDPAITSGNIELITDEPIYGLFYFNYISKEWCKYIIDKAEKNSKWTSDRHDNYPTYDMLLCDLDTKLDREYIDQLDGYIKPMLIKEFAIEGNAATDVWYYETFIVKYNKENQPSLNLHHDASEFSAVLRLNDDFTGGGTYFSRQKKLIEGDVGHMFVHPGRYTHRHGARSIISGTRYIIVTFIRMS